MTMNINITNMITLLGSHPYRYMDMYRFPADTKYGTFSSETSPIYNSVYCDSGRTYFCGLRHGSIYGESLF
jgi:hypothetical protein